MTSSPMAAGQPARQPALSPALLVLALSSFAIGTTEFVIMGLLPEVATDLEVSIPVAGWLVSGYALGVAFGAPFMAMATAKLPRKTALLALMGIFILGNALCALSPGYNVLMVARVITALCHGAFFGIGSVVAASLAAPDRKASAVALMFMGLTLANVLGVPLGTALGLVAGWRMTFWAVTLIGVAALAGLAWLLPARDEEAKVDLMREIGALRGGAIWLALLTTTLFSASMFALFTYIAPILQSVTLLPPRGVTWTLLLIGVGLTVGNMLGGRFADRSVAATLIGVPLGMAAFSTLFSWTSQAFIPAEITLFAWAVVAFGAVAALQINVVGTGGRAPNLVATLNIGAFNVGNALGAWIGGLMIDHGFALTQLPLAAAGIALAAALAAAFRPRSAGGERLVSAKP